MFSKSVLANGVRIVTEHQSQSRAVSTGIWIQTGTRDETDREAGLSHFLEHMVFKGTQERSAYRIAHELEAVGGDLNAFTTQEYTCFHSICLKDDLALQIDVLCDLVTNAKFDKREIEREKGVVLQEIAMTADQPEEQLFDIFFDEVFGDHRLGRPILGLEKSVKSFKQSDLLRYYRGRYAPSNIVVSIAGGVDHEKAVSLLDKRLGRVKRKFDVRRRTQAKFHPFTKVIHKESEQAHLVIGVPSATFKSKYRFEAFILNSLLGGGMTSKLYQKIREKRGLAYSVYSQLTTFTDSGVAAIYAGTEPRNVELIIDLIVKELKTLKRRRVSESDLKLFKTQVRGGILLGADDVDNRMNSLGVNEMIFGEYRPVDKVVEDIEKVTTKSLKSYADEFLDLEQLAVLVLGDVNEERIKKALKKAL